MGVKRKSRILAILIAAALIATSAIGVFADEKSPYHGVVSGGSAQANSTTSGYASWTAAKGAAYYNVYLNDVLVAGHVKTTNVTLPLKKDKHYIVKVAAVREDGVEGPRTVIGRLCTVKSGAKVKAKRAGKRTIRVSWKKVKKVNCYKIAIYENGKYLKTVTAGKKATSKKIKKLKKGAKYKFTVYPICKNGSLDGIRKSSKTVKCK